MVLERQVPDDPDLIPAAVRLFPTLNGLDRERLAQALGKYGPAARAVVPELVELLDQAGGFGPAAEAAAALGAITSDAAAALPALRKLRRHPDVKAALAARDAIARIEGK